MSSEGTTTATNTGVTSSDEKNLVVSFIQFIRQKVSRNECSDEQIEGLEVAVQCLEGAFGLTDASYAFQPSKPLLAIFTAAEGLGVEGETKLADPTPSEIEQANKLKEEGNDLMKANQFDAAIQKYNEAIKLSRDPVYFCNRAAAYCRLEQYDLAIQDCRTAIALDENYSKAYGRMGLALSCQNRYEQAIEVYKKAIELDPTQESYKNNLKIAEEKVAELNAARQGSDAGGFASLFGGAGGGIPDFGSFLQNPAMMQMANSLMNDPNVQGMMQQIMTGNGMQDFFQAGQAMARQMQESNPDFVENLRRQYENNDNNQNRDGNPPPPPQPPQ